MKVVVMTAARRGGWRTTSDPWWSAGALMHWVVLVYWSVIMLCDAVDDASLSGTLHLRSADDRFAVIGASEACPFNASIWVSNERTVRLNNSRLLIVISYNNNNNNNTLIDNIIVNSLSDT